MLSILFENFSVNYSFDLQPKNKQPQPGHATERIKQPIAPISGGKASTIVLLC